VNRAFLLASAIVACLFALANCDRPPVATTTAETKELRIVSFSPAISRTLVDFGLQDRIVGRTQYCSSLDQSIPVVGDLQTIDFEALLRVRPTHIVIQPPAGVVDPHLRELADVHQWKISDWRLNSIDDVRALVREIPQRLFAEGSNERAEMSRRGEALLGRIDRTLAPSPESPAMFGGTVLMVESVNPVLAFGANTYLHDVLVSLGGKNSLSESGWVQLSLEDVVRLAPEAIIIVAPGKTSMDVDHEAGPMTTLDVPAAKARRIAILAHPDALLPSSGVTGVAQDLQSILREFAVTATTQDNRPR
jgi:iron complex transport system substrate-binding protein